MDTAAELRRSRPAKFLEPLVFEPESEHNQTFVVLHGRGSTAEKFAEPLLSHNVSPCSDNASSCKPDLTQSLRKCFPGTKWVFPTASLQRAVIYKRSLTDQWFDNWSLDKPEYRQELQILGLQESCRYIHSLLQAAIQEVGAGNVVLVGLSQGCATSLIALLLWQGLPIKAMVGMCGWLPFRKALQQVSGDISGDQSGEDLGDNPFDCVEGATEHTNDKLHMMRQWLVEEFQWDVDLTEQSVSLTQTPILLAHGKEDEKVPHELDRLASSLLADAGLDVTFKSYEGLAHWYSADMLRDVVHFLRTSHLPAPPASV